MNYIIGRYYIYTQMFTVHFQFYYMQMYRFTIYKMLLFNTPPEMYFCISLIKFCFFLMSTTAIHVPKEIFVEQLTSCWVYGFLGITI